MKGLILKDETKNFVKETVADFEQAVGNTLGPDGDYAIISNGTASKTTKDGANVAKTIDYDIPAKSYIANIIQEAAVKTETECGDGTTTTTLLTCGFHGLLSKHNTYLEHKHIERLCDTALELVDELVIRNEEDVIRKAALTTANGDESIANLLSDIVLEEKGVVPVINFKENTGPEDIVEVIDGYKVPLTLEIGNDVNINDRWVFINERLMTPEQCVRLVDQKGFTLKNINIVVKGFEPSFAGVDISRHTPEQQKSFMNVMKQTTIFNANIGGGLSVELLKDQAVLFGGQYYDGLQHFLSDMEIYDDWFKGEGEVSKKETFVPGDNREVNQRVKVRLDELNFELNRLRGADKYSVSAGMLRERIKRLTNKGYTIYIGGDTHSDYLERKDRFDDVYLSLVSNVVHGCLPGINSSLIHVVALMSEMDLEWVSADIIADFFDVLLKQSRYLEPDKFNDAELQNGFLSHHYLRVTNLRTGEQIQFVRHSPVCPSAGPYTSEETEKLFNAVRDNLEVFDPAYAIVAAIKGGFKTAKILSKLSTVVLSNKLFSVK